MRRYLLGIFLATAVMSTSCSKSDTLDDTALEGTVRFQARINDREDNWGNLSTRGVPIDNTTIHQFSVYCFQTARKQWVDTMAYALPNKMYDVLVSRDGNNWNYNPPVKWEGGDGSYFTFFGYSPRATGIYREPDLPLGNNLELVTTAADPGVPVISYSTMDYVPMQVDLLLAKPVYNTHPVEKVNMQFAHALSQIRFKGWSAQQGTSVKSIAVNGIQYKGTVAIDGGQIVWTSEVDTKDFSVVGNFPPVSTDEQKMTDLTAGGNEFMLLPQDMSGNSAAKIIITALVAGAEKSTEYTIKENWTVGKSYTYTINLGGNPNEEIIITDVTITDWIVDSEEDMSTTPPANPVNPVTPPTADQWVEIDGLKWTKGNLVATSSTANNVNGCKVGNPEDGGLYFQFGSLIGWKGGAAANGGTGEGTNPNPEDGKWWNGAASFSWSNDAMVWPAAMASTPAAWSDNVEQANEADAFKKWYFDFSGTSGGVNYSTAWSDIRSYTHPTLGALKDGKMAALGVGDPCTYYLGAPWRMPTAAEYKALFDNADSVGVLWDLTANWSWVTSPYNGAQRTGNSLYFPASGTRDDSDGAFIYMTMAGYNWASSVGDGASGSMIGFLNAGAFPGSLINRSCGTPVRCVSGTYTPPVGTNK